MSMDQLIRTRRTIKSFKPDPIAETALLHWLETASYAPNHRMNEPWELLRVGPATRAKLNHKTDFGHAPVVLALLSKPAATAFERDENLLAVACFAQNFLLAAHEAGVGAYWASMGALPQNREILGVQEGYDVVGLFAIGYPEEIPNVRPRTSIADKLTLLP
ncbi:nitroreductase family protein [Paenibacillus sp. NFR01]|uniref:nitroreductase family protein n=1 Tax=Paenibacillus sp. NFR01 TaxID=1566279 RepID=UPI0008CF3FF1|nr:nitroreductase family protein [Paenibacillus sp. NFR01]SET20576.1 Nitroreductase [Paenibacillus sp. NFR01]